MMALTNCKPWLGATIQSASVACSSMLTCAGGVTQMSCF